MALKEWRVKYYLEDQDGRTEYMEFATREEAQAFYDSLDGRAELQRYVEEINDYEVVLYPTYEY